jgi:hypothetical protein
MQVRSTRPVQLTFDDQDAQQLAAMPADRAYQQVELLQFVGEYLLLADKQRPLAADCILTLLTLHVAIHLKQDTIHPWQQLSGP